MNPRCAAQPNREFYLSEFNLGFNITQIAIVVLDKNHWFCCSDPMNYDTTLFEIVVSFVVLKFIRIYLLIKAH